MAVDLALEVAHVLVEPLVDAVETPLDLVLQVRDGALDLDHVLPRGIAVGALLVGEDLGARLAAASPAGDGYREPAGRDEEGRDAEHRLKGDRHGVTAPAL